MKTIKINIKNNEMNSKMAAAEVGENYTTVAEESIKEFKMRGETVKVILRSRDAWNNRIQKTFYVYPI